jgi:hypothetical protein
MNVTAEYHVDFPINMCTLRSRVRTQYEVECHSVVLEVLGLK